MSEKLPAIDWIKRIENPEIREKALRNIENPTLTRFCIEGDTYVSLQYALMGAFSWANSPEGHDYWSELHDNPPDLILHTKELRERDEKLLREFAEWFRRTQVANIFIDEGEITDFLNQKYKQ